jgi:hypothetical protein
LGVRFAVISGHGFVPDEDVALGDVHAHGVSIVAHGRPVVSRPCVEEHQGLEGGSYCHLRAHRCPLQRGQRWYPSLL